MRLAAGKRSSAALVIKTVLSEKKKKGMPPGPTEIVWKGGGSKMYTEGPPKNLLATSFVTRRKEKAPACSDK